jgi:tetratricopeptide (TPR) repeat protein
MTTYKRNDPVAYKGVMVSSTFTDLVQHRDALIDAIDGQELKAVVMENDAARPAIDVLDSSLEMVRKAAAYVGVISHKYGQVPEDPKRNPDNLSLTELEFLEARRLGRPVLLFIMGPDHPVKAGDVETDPAKRAKLDAFRENAKRISADSKVHRVYKVFNSLQEFETAAVQSVAELRRHLHSLDDAEEEIPEPEKPRDGVPSPPALYAEPPYIGSHKFVGRESQLQTLNDWAAAADPHPVLLFEAIGGAGKSMLTWEWTKNRATSVRSDWAGRFWYSFYERGAVMADFCRRALAYMTWRPLQEFRGKKTAELGELLLAGLRARPWLLVLDGLERVLVAYHRIDAAQLADEEAGKSDAIARRDPTAAIHPDDDDLLRALASAAPSKLLLTSRLIPRVLLNRSSQPVPGVRHERLPGLRPPDAEALLRSCGITGDSEAIQKYLQAHCDCHPLVTGVLAGLINDYLPDRGNFDAWANAGDGGLALNLADLDLVQKRNHILRAALDALPDKSRQLLSTLALLSEAVDYETLSALNPHLHPDPEEVEEPNNPEESWRWESMSADEKAVARRRYKWVLQARRKYEEELSSWRSSDAVISAARELTRTVRDLEDRGLLQYDHATKRYDLHPVVRGIAAGGLRQEEKETYGQKVVDHFSGKSHNPYDAAESIDDLSAGLHIVRTLIQMGRYEAAASAYRDGLGEALTFNLEAHAAVLSLIRPFFHTGWASLPTCVPVDVASYLVNEAGIALHNTGQLEEALAAYAIGLLTDVQSESWTDARVSLANIAEVLHGQNRLAAQHRQHQLEVEVADLIGVSSHLFMARLRKFRSYVTQGAARAAEEMWRLLDPMGRDWRRGSYRPGNAEYDFAVLKFARGDLTEQDLLQAEEIARSGNNRVVLRSIHALRGKWHVNGQRWNAAATSLGEAVRMARAVQQTDAAAEAQLALANFRLGRLHDPRNVVEELSRAKDVSDIDLAALWLAIGDAEEAKKHALAAYRWATADGEPFVRRHELNQARAVLEQLGAEIPDLPPYDPANDSKFPWEEEVEAAIEKLRASKASDTRGESSTDPSTPE